MTQSAPLPLLTVVDGKTFRLRQAAKEDLPAIVALLKDDALGSGRKTSTDLAPYEQAFQAVDADPCHLLLVAELLPAGAKFGLVIATFQLSFSPGLSRKGSWRSQVEGVRVSSKHRGHGLGNLMMGWAIDESRSRGCALLQLTTDKSRTDAHRFYQRLGFEASHEGMKLIL